MTTPINMVVTLETLLLLLGYFLEVFAVLSKKRRTHMLLHMILHGDGQSHFSEEPVLSSTYADKSIVTGPLGGMTVSTIAMGMLLVGLFCVDSSSTERFKHDDVSSV